MGVERVGGALFVAAIALLAFVGGALVVLSEVFPHQFLRNAHKAGVALIDKQTGYLDRFKTDLWRQARTPTRGLAEHDRERALAGYTLYTSGHGAHAILITMEGRVAHEWHRPFSSLWHEGAAVDDPQRDELIYMRKAFAFPSGELLALYVAAGDSPWGYGLAKLDRESNVIWSYLEHTHHDFDVGPDGRIYVLTHEFTDEVLDAFEQLERPRLDDFLVVLSPDGKELDKVALVPPLARSAFKNLVYATPSFALADPLHTNAVELIDERAAAVFPYGNAGDVLLSFREPGVVAVLDIEAEEYVWASRGSWIGQHDPSILESGRILLFDNLGAYEEGNNSQVIELDPTTMAIVWRYRGDARRPFESDVRSAAERLPNGNTLITESDGGRLFEVTADGDIVWEFHNPVRGGEEDQFIPVVSWGQRLAPDYFEPGFRARMEQRRAATQVDTAPMP